MRGHSRNRTTSVNREQQRCAEIKHGALTKVMQSSMIERSDSVLEAEKGKVESIPLESRFLCGYYLVSLPNLTSLLVVSSILFIDNPNPKTPPISHFILYPPLIFLLSYPLFLTLSPELTISFPISSSISLSILLSISLSHFLFHSTFHSPLSISLSFSILHSQEVRFS